MSGIIARPSEVEASASANPSSCRAMKNVTPLSRPSSEESVLEAIPLRSCSWISRTPCCHPYRHRIGVYRHRIGGLPSPYRHPWILVPRNHQHRFYTIYIELERERERERERAMKVTVVTEIPGMPLSQNNSLSWVVGSFGGPAYPRTPKLPSLPSLFCRTIVISNYPTRTYERS